MSFATPVPRYMVARKPPHGSPCNRCGVCCVVSLCQLAKHIHGDQPGPCPELLLNQEGRSSCGLTTVNGSPQHKAGAALLIRAGQGCDARINGEAINDQFNIKLDRLDELQKEEIAAAKAIWGME